ncbi:aminotransferase class I/II-fold pyridoxal phosphate-dependent enzyme [Aminipila butyrica]|uniref:Aminotransferase class I/II-fold pyridoxal phosphate-dependent enzyme n=1 Tax=Aminipila butyrica TaxID=433296 RepID=A0A858BX70_9FIRM|nr:histidinol-phosphate transaminase [Aminipila butyrica]QIB69490.1 aminotransferase class I/II-fold pyridoxal phosphate-dependent enzyme [Aminipila butyrica]
MANLVHGGDIYSAQEKGIADIVDFSANINPRGLPPQVKQAIIDGLDSCVNYPDPLCRELIAGISAFEGLDKDAILCGNGAADIIFRFVLAWKPKKALVLAPTFAEYEQALHTVGCETVHYSLKEEEDFVLTENYLNALDSSYDVIFLCNPNNPTGQLISKTLLEKILQVCTEKQIMMVLDECFIEFVEDYESCTMKEYIKTNENLMILKAFTKSYAMPGLRLGYGLSSNQKLMKGMTHIGQPWSVSIPAQLAGIQALKEKEYLNTSLKEIREEKAFLVSELNELRIKNYHPAANYILFNIRDHERYCLSDFKEKLLQQGIIIRDCSNYVGLEEGYYRIAVKSHQANERLIAALKSI